MPHHLPLRGSGDTYGVNQDAIPRHRGLLALNNQSRSNLHKSVVCRFLAYHGLNFSISQGGLYASSSDISFTHYVIAFKRAQFALIVR